MAGDWLRLWPAQVLHMISSTSLGLGNLICLVCCSLGIHRIAGEGLCPNETACAAKMAAQSRRKARVLKMMGGILPYDCADWAPTFQ